MQTVGEQQKRHDMAAHICMRIRSQKQETLQFCAGAEILFGMGRPYRGGAGGAYRK